MISCLGFLEMIPTYGMDLEFPKPEVTISIDWLDDDRKDVPSQIDPNDVNTLVFKEGPLDDGRAKGRS
jgi:hypothetical protein